MGGYTAKRGAIYGLPSAKGDKLVAPDLTGVTYGEPLSDAIFQSALDQGYATVPTTAAAKPATELTFGRQPVQLVAGADPDAEQAAAAAQAASARRVAASAKQDAVGEPADAQTVAGAAANRRSIGTAVGLAAGGQALQAGASFIPTAADKENRLALARLQRRRATGRTGEDTRRDAIMDREMMSPVRAMAEEGRVRTEQQLATAPGQQTAGAIQQARETQARTVAEAARGAGLAKAKARSERIDNELAELQNRINFKGKRQQEKINAVGSALGKIGDLAGTAVAYQRVRTPDVTPALDVGMESDETLALMEAVGETSNQGGLLSFFQGARKQRSE